MDNCDKAFSASGILDSQAVRQTIPELQIPMPLPADRADSFRDFNAFELEGSLTNLLINVRWKSGDIGEEEARRLSRAFLASLLPVGREHATIFRLEGPWTPWFKGVFWDTTILIFDPQPQRWILFCYTLC